MFHVKQNVDHSMFHVKHFFICAVLSLNKVINITLKINEAVLRPTSSQNVSRGTFCEIYLPELYFYWINNSITVTMPH